TLVQDQKAYPDYPTAIAAIVKAGTPLILQDQAGFRDNIASAYTQKLMTIADIDAALRGNLRVRFRVGDLDPPDRVPGKQILGTETAWAQRAAWETAAVAPLTRCRTSRASGGRRTGARAPPGRRRRTSPGRPSSCSRTPA